MNLYVITVIKEQDNMIVDHRTVGIFTNLNRAEASIKNNHMDIWEAYYNYACVETINSDEIYSLPEEQKFFKFNIDKMMYESCDNRFDICPVSDIG